MFDVVLAPLLSSRELIDVLEPEVIADHVASMTDRRLRQYTDEVLLYSHPLVWNSMPKLTRELVYDRVRAAMPGLIRELLSDAAEHVEQLVSLRAVFVARLAADREALVRMFEETAGPLLAFVPRLAAVLGFALGFAALAGWRTWPTWWFPPVAIACVAIVGHTLASLALPPLFLRNRATASRAWCRFVATEALSLQHVAYGMLYGPESERTKELVRRHVQPIVDEVVRAYDPMATLAFGRAGIGTIRDRVGEKAVAVSTDPFDHWAFNRNRSARLEELLRSRVDALPDATFVEVLRPCLGAGAFSLALWPGAVFGVVAGGLLLGWALM